MKTSITSRYSLNVKQHRVMHPYQLNHIRFRSQPIIKGYSQDFLTTASIWIPLFCKAGTAFIGFYSFQQWLMYHNINQDIDKREKEKNDEKKKK